MQGLFVLWGVLSDGVVGRVSEFGYPVGRPVPMFLIGRSYFLYGSHGVVVSVSDCCTDEAGSISGLGKICM